MNKTELTLQERLVDNQKIVAHLSHIYAPSSGFTDNKKVGPKMFI